MSYKKACLMLFTMIPVAMHCDSSTLSQAEVPTQPSIEQGENSTRGPFSKTEKLSRLIDSKRAEAFQYLQEQLGRIEKMSISKEDKASLKKAMHTEFKVRIKSIEKLLGMYVIQQNVQQLVQPAR